MSYYYNYTIGIMDKEGKIKPYGPYDANGNLKYVIERSRSFASDLYKDFLYVQEGQITDELCKEFSYTDWNDQEKIEIKYLPIDKLPKGTYLIKGYFLIEDIQRYEEDQIDVDDLICNMITPIIYAEKLKKEYMFGKNEPKEDDEGYKYTEPNASDYMYYVVEDYHSKEYEAEIIRNVADILDEYNLPVGCELVVLETEG